MLDEIYFEKLEKIRPYLEAYNDGLLRMFNEFLLNPSKESIGRVRDYIQTNEASVSAGNAYGYINYIHLLTGIIEKELELGFTPISEGTKDYQETIDRFHKTVFMKRRYELMGGYFENETDASMLEEADDYMIDDQISPIVLSHIIIEEYGARPADVLEHWMKVYENAGKHVEAVLLKELVLAGY